MDPTADPLVAPRTEADPVEVSTRRPAGGLRGGWLALAVAVLAAVPFLPTLRNGFVNWDDPANFLDNYRFRGLGAGPIRWAWTTTLAGVYQPLGWMLLEAEYALWGLDPKGYHAASVALHAANAAAVYALAVALLGRCLPAGVRADRRAVRAGAALAALIFATHPLRVEAVAWASCQVYLPSVLLGMLAVLAYLRAGEAGGRGWIAVAWALYLGALLSKAVALPLPIVLLILDIYPLRRLGPGRWTGPGARRALLEKAPFLAIGLVFMAMAVKARTDTRTMLPLEDFRASAWAAQASYGVVFYPLKTLAPTGLTTYYPVPARLDLRARPFWACGLAAVAITAGAALLARRRPGITAAWAAYLAILAPNLGQTPPGLPIATDRYSYAATIPLAVLLAAGLAALLHRARGRPGAFAAIVAAGLCAVAAESARSWRQSATWRDSEALWAHALAHGGAGSELVHENLGAALFTGGDLRGAEAHLTEALRLNPSFATAHYSLGRILYERGDRAGAAREFAEALRLRPGYADASFNLGVILAGAGRLEEAAGYYARALRLRPDDPAAHTNLAAVRLQQGRPDVAARHFAEALRLRPDSPKARLGLEHARRERARGPHAE